MYVKKNGALKIQKRRPLKPLNWDLKSHPDLFPALSVLCSQADGVSRLSGLKTQAYKESHRLRKIQELLALCGIKTVESKDTLQIFGSGGAQRGFPDFPPSDFSAAEDHRIVMAAALLQAVGYPIRIQGREAVKKSWPGFFDWLKITLYGSCLSFQVLFFISISVRIVDDRLKPP